MSKPIACEMSLAPAATRRGDQRARRARASTAARNTMLPAIMRVRGVIPILYSCSVSDRQDSM